MRTYERCNTTGLERTALICHPSHSYLVACAGTVHYVVLQSVSVAVIVATALVVVGGVYYFCLKLTFTKFRLGYLHGDLNFFDLRSAETKPIHKMENLHSEKDIRELQWISDHEILSAAPDGLYVR